MTENERYAVADHVVSQLKEYGDPWNLSEEARPKGGVERASGFDQLKQFFKGTMRPKIIVRRKGLRLISDRPQQAKIVHRRWNDDDDNGPNNAA